MIIASNTGIRELIDILATEVHRMENAFRQVEGLPALLNKGNRIEKANMGAKNHAILMPDGQKFSTSSICVF